MQAPGFNSLIEEVQVFDKQTEEGNHTALKKRGGVNKDGRPIISEQLTGLSSCSTDESCDL